MNHKITMLLCLGFFLEVQAQNLLSNPTFDTDTAGWNNPFVDSSWISDDGGPESGNGSLQISTDLNNSTSFFMEANAVAITANHTYYFAGYYKIPSDSPAVFALLEIAWLRADTSVIDYDDIWSTFMPPQGIWSRLANSAVAPADATHAIFTVYFQSAKSSEMDPSYGRWDDLVFIEDSIFLNGFD